MAIRLSDDGHEVLGRWARDGSGRLPVRARIVLACADGLDNKDVAARLGVTEPTVTRWRRRFGQRR